MHLSSISGVGPSPTAVPEPAAEPAEREVDGYRLRAARPETAEALSFYRRVLGLELDPAVWEWRFHGRPEAPSIFPAVYTADGELVGLNPAVPRRVWVAGQVVELAQACHSAVAAEHRAKSPLYLELVKLLGDLSAARGIPVGYGGGANEAAVRVGCTLAGFRLLHRLPVMERRLSWRPAARHRLGTALGGPVGALLDRIATPRPRRPPAGLQVEEVPSVAAQAADFDALWEHGRDSMRVGLVRDAAALDWRWSRCPVPSVLLGARRGGELLGYLVLRVHDEAWGRCATVLDLFPAPPPDQLLDEVATALLEAAGLQARARGAGFLRFAPSVPRLQLRLAALPGWRPAPAEPDHVLIRATVSERDYPQHAELMRELCRPEGWYYAQGDSDFGD